MPAGSVADAVAACAPPKSPTRQNATTPAPIPGASQGHPAPSRFLPKLKLLVLCHMIKTDVILQRFLHLTFRQCPLPLLPQRSPGGEGRREEAVFSVPPRSLPVPGKVMTFRQTHFMMNLCSKTNQTV